MDFMSSKPSTINTVVRVESEPPGAEAKAPGGQGCRTPCSLNVAAAGDFTVNFALNGYLPQSVSARVFPPDDPRGDSEFASSALVGPRVVPDPIFAALEPAPPSAHKKPPTRPRISAVKPPPTPAPTPAPAAAAAFPAPPR
ncbi:MAG TPA: PEGA domain-containing protein [Xanthobacteraceae bacterium]|jgi:hypothetical protein|nr:PEGA domain-containing protein [Xanthobacteraceae bacterium]